MNDYLTADGVPVCLSDRTCNDCPMLRADTIYLFGKRRTYSRCGVSGVTITPAHKACFYYPKVAEWISLNATSSGHSGE